jgi:hypothetical protein
MVAESPFSIYGSLIARAARFDLCPVLDEITMLLFRIEQPSVNGVTSHVVSAKRRVYGRCAKV